MNVTFEQLFITAFVLAWIIFDFILYHIINKLLPSTFKSFYLHPAVGMIKFMKADTFYKKGDLFFATILSIITYFPITCEWFVCFCLYKFWKFIYVDDIVEQKIEEEIKEQSINDIKEEENVEQDKASLHAEQMEKDLENPEYISKDGKSDDYFRSQEFLNYLHDNKDNEVIAYGIDLAQTPDIEINKVEDVKNISIMNNEDKPKVEQEVKSKRKYNKKKKVENSNDNNETKNN